MTLSVLDGPDAIHTYMGYGCAKVADAHFVVMGEEVGAKYVNVLQATGGNLTVGADRAWSPSLTTTEFPAIARIPGTSNVLVIQLAVSAGTELTTLARIGSVNTGTLDVSWGTEYSVEHTGDAINEWPQLVVLSETTAIMWYQKTSNNGVVDYYGSYYRVITMAAGVISFGSEQVFKNHTNVSGTIFQSICGFPYAVTRQIPDASNKIYMIYQNIDTDDDGVFAVNATLVGSSLVIGSDVSVDETAISPMFQNSAVESSIAPLNPFFFAGGFEYAAAGGFGYSFAANSSPPLHGTIYELGDRRDRLGFDRLTNTRFLLVTDGVSTNHARICTVTGKSISFGTELDLGTDGGACLGVWSLADDRALIVVGTQAVVIQSDSDELVTTTFPGGDGFTHSSGGIPGAILEIPA